MFRHTTREVSCFLVEGLGVWVLHLIPPIELDGGEMSDALIGTQLFV